MSHLALLAFLIYFSLAVAAVSYLVRAYNIYKSSYIKFYLIYFLMFCSCHSIFMLTLYVNTNTQILAGWNYHIPFEIIIVEICFILLYVSLYYFINLVYGLLQYKNTVFRRINVLISSVIWIFNMFSIITYDTNFSSMFIYVTSLILQVYYVLISLGLIVFLYLKSGKRFHGERLKAVRFFAIFHFLIFSILIVVRISTLGAYLYITIFLLVTSLLNAAPLFFLMRFIAMYEDTHSIGSFGSESYGILLKNLSITPREAEVIQLIVEGKTNREISAELCISYQTVKDHIYRIYKKTNVNNRIQLITMLRQRVLLIKDQIV